MFTSRAEYRILLRQDNADMRLTPLAQALGIEVEDRMTRVDAKRKANAEIKQFFEEMSVEPSEVEQYLVDLGSAPLTQKMKLIKVLLRPDVSILGLAAIMPRLKDFIAQFDPEFVEYAEINAKYAGYIEKEQEMAEKMIRLESVKLLENFDYSQIQGLSAEAREKLNRVKPATIGQASRISGVSPSDISVLLIFVGR
jgi:tRNA uridine 5-carboxymethylaminomethyl modification enzyme